MYYINRLVGRSLFQIYLYVSHFICFFSCSVHLVKSHAAAAGKSLKVQRMQQKLENMMKEKPGDQLPLCVSIPVHRKQVDVSSIMKRFRQVIPDPEKPVPRIFHIDLDHDVS